ncbi:hypothetical protein MKX03_022493 [Papaver bracteatum]|nr:hypothetical protein MKX03_022493 [Papaver bracteatum]
MKFQYQTINGSGNANTIPNGVAAKVGSGPTPTPEAYRRQHEISVSIIQNGYAYAADGHVYFSVEKFPAYGPLFGRKLEDNLAGGGEGVQDNLTATKGSQK